MYQYVMWMYEYVMYHFPLRHVKIGHMYHFRCTLRSNSLWIGSQNSPIHLIRYMPRLRNGPTVDNDEWREQNVGNNSVIYCFNISYSSILHMSNDRDMTSQICNIFSICFQVAGLRWCSRELALIKDASVKTWNGQTDGKLASTTRFNRDLPSSVVLFHRLPHCADARLSIMLESTALRVNRIHRKRKKLDYAKIRLDRSSHYEIGIINR